MTHLESADKYIADQFKDVWYESLAVDSVIVVDSDTLQNRVISKLEEAARYLYNCFNFSIFEGEYVLNIRRDIESINILGIQIQRIGDVLDTPVLQDFFTSSFYYSLKKSIKSYKYLLRFVERQLVYQHDTSILFNYDADRMDGINESESVAKTMGNLFMLNIGLAIIDHSIAFVKEHFTRLLIIKFKLNELKTDSIERELLMKKCDFLLFKLSIRLKQEQKNYLYAIDFNFQSVDLREHEVLGFSFFNDIIFGHYDTGITPRSFVMRRDMALTKLENNESLNLDDYHALIKYFKDESKDIKKLRLLRDHYDNYYQKAKIEASEFNKKALDIAFCYIENNLISLSLDKGEFNLNNWEKELKKYTDRADTFKNKNFFPYYKIIKEFLSPEITNLLKVHEDVKARGTVETQKLIGNYEVLLSSLVENLGICEETNYLTFQNTDSICKVSFKVSDGTDRSCFISSSYVLPLNYKKQREEMEKFKSELNKFKSLIAIQIIIDADRAEIQTIIDADRTKIQTIIDADRTEIQSIKREIESTDKKHIEILSIFAALVMFVSNEIQIFSKIPNMADAVAYSLFFAHALGVFVLMIWLITRPTGLSKQNLKFTHWSAIFYFVTVTTAAVLYVFCHDGTNKSNKSKLDYTQYKIDSVKSAQKLDSLIGKKNDTIPSKK